MNMGSRRRLHSDGFSFCGLQRPESTLSAALLSSQRQPVEHLGDRFVALLNASKDVELRRIARHRPLLNRTASAEAGDEQLRWSRGLERRARFHIHRHQLAVRCYVHDLATVVPPMRLHPPYCRDLPPLVPLGEAGNVRLPSSGLARTIRHPFAIGRNRRLVDLVIRLIDQFRLTWFARTQQEILPAAQIPEEDGAIIEPSLRCFAIGSLIDQLLRPATDGLAIEMRHAQSVVGEDDLASIGRENRIAIVGGVERNSRKDAARELQHPDVVAAILATVHGQSFLIRRKSDLGVIPGRSCGADSFTFSVEDCDDRTRIDGRSKGESAALRHRERSKGALENNTDLVHHWEERAGEPTPRKVERLCNQAFGTRKEEMALRIRARSIALHHPAGLFRPQRSEVDARLRCRPGIIEKMAGVRKELRPRLRRLLSRWIERQRRNGLTSAVRYL